MKYEAVPIETNEEARKAYLAERCDVYTTDASGLAATKATFKDPENHPFYLVYASPSFYSQQPGAMSTVLIYKINHDYNPQN